MPLVKSATDCKRESFSDVFVRSYIVTIRCSETCKSPKLEPCSDISYPNMMPALGLNMHAHQRTEDGEGSS